MANYIKGVELGQAFQDARNQAYGVGRKRIAELVGNIDTLERTEEEDHKIKSTAQKITIIEQDISHRARLFRRAFGRATYTGFGGDVMEVYSYHTFLYPFLWNNDENISREKFESALLEFWTEDNMITAQNTLSSIERPNPWNNEEQPRLDYQVFQYFNAAAREVLFRGNGDIVHGWVYRPGKVHNKGIYQIDAKGKNYKLNVNHIRLRLFNTGVGILAFELEYPLPAGGREQARKDVLEINEYGRRLYPEYLPYTIDGDGSFDKENICASRITLDLGEGVVFKEEIKKKAEAHIDQKTGDLANSYLNDPLQNKNFIKTLLLGEDQKFQIVPAIDDRMFVCCCILDSDYVDHFLGYPAWPDDQCIGVRQMAFWKFMKDWETGKELYALTNIDAGKSSCQNRVMLNQYFEEQLYLRWLEIGTIHAVTNHSMVCLTSPYVMDSVVNPFLIEYVQMVILVQAQRASLLAFDSCITETIRSVRGKQGTMEIRILDRLIELEENFAVFQGQMLLQEVTPQIQGIELYEKLQKMLFIGKLEKGVQQQLNNLYEIAESKRAKQQEQQRIDEENAMRRQELFFSVFAILGIFSAWVDLTDYVEKWYKPSEFPFAIISGVFISIIVIIFAYIIFRKPRKKGPQTQKEEIR